MFFLACLAAPLGYLLIAGVLRALFAQFDVQMKWDGFDRPGHGEMAVAWPLTFALFLLYWPGLLVFRAGRVVFRAGECLFNAPIRFVQERRSRAKIPEARVVK